MSQINSYTPFDGEITSDNIEELLAHHKRTFGGVLMEASGEGEGSEDESNDEGEDSEGDEPNEDESGDEGSDEGDESGDDENEDELPDWARKKMKKANGEAARYRKKLRDIEQKFEDAKTADEFEGALSELREDNEKETRALLVENVALKFKLPEELAARLQGATREELEADAKTLAEFVTSEDEERELRGGLDPNDDGDGDDDPGALARKVNRGRRKSR